MATADYPADWDKKYTDPALRARLKDEVVAGDKGGKPGQWSARKAQLLKADYEKAGGGYLGPKDASQQHLSQWSEEDWQTSDGSARARTDSEEERGGASKRYLPKEAWEHLSEEEKRATDAKKAEGSAHGDQFVPNTDAAEEAGREARHHDRAHDDAAAAENSLPIEGYDQLSAKDAAKAVGGLEDEAEVRAVRDHERTHANRKTVLERAEHRLE
jgi:hypothetical protein